jgi:hypothetical protein
MYSKKVTIIQHRRMHENFFQHFIYIQDEKFKELP